MCSASIILTVSSAMLLNGRLPCGSVGHLLLSGLAQPSDPVTLTLSLNLT